MIIYFLIQFIQFNLDIFNNLFFIKINYSIENFVNL